MKIASLKPSFSPHRWTLCLLLLCFGYIPTVHAADIALGKEINVVGEESREPAWKQMWDSARKYTRNQQYKEAVPYYREVLKQKPNIEEVKWELCRVLIQTESYGEASLLLDSLLETDPDRTEYLLSAADIALLTGKEKQAVLYFGQVLEQEPGGTFYFQALSGLVDALIQQGKRKPAIPLMEQLYQSGGESAELLLNLSETLVQLGLLQKAGYYYRELINKYRVNPQVLRQAASVFERLEAMDTAASLWERYLAESTESLSLRQKLSDYYLVEKRTEEALPHLLVLLDHDINREAYLLEVGRIYLTTLGRADKALHYYERYHEEFPQGKDVTTEIANIRLILANNLLSIVENDGVWLLWNDLARITPDRIGIYMAMADLLEALGKNKELMEVLQVINFYNPEDIEIRLKLSSLYYNDKAYQRCLGTLYEIRNRERLPEEYFHLRMRCEKSLNNDQALVSSYLEYLDLFPDDESARSQAIELGGAVGDVSAVKRLLEGYRQHSGKDTGSERNIVKTAVDAFIMNQFLTEADQLVSAILQEKTIDADTYTLFARESARIKYLFGRKFAAEQELRILLLRDQDNFDTIFALAENAIDSGEMQAASVWLSMAEKKIATDKHTNDMSEQLSRLRYFQLLVNQQSGNFASMRDAASAHLESRAGRTEAFNSYDYKIVTMLAAHYYNKQSYQLFKNTLSHHAHYLGDSDLVSSLLLTRPEFSAGQDGRDPWNAVFEKKAASALFDLFEFLMMLGETETAEHLLDHLENRLDESVRFSIARSRVYLDRSQDDKAMYIYRRLASDYPEETFFRDQARTIEVHGNLAPQGYHTEENQSNFDFPKATIFEQRLEAARSAWVTDNEAEALEIYKELEMSLRAEIHPVLEAVKEIDAYRSISEETFWDNFLDSENDIRLLDQLMGSAFFAAHLDDQIAKYTAAAYESYRWLKIVGKERKAKQALNKREFYQAEKRYQELVEEENVRDANVYTDLATVYNRLERYAKETELLEKIKEQKISYPQLKSVFEKNTNRRRPQMTVESLFREEDGRNGAVNTKQQYLGLALKIQPTLYQEAGFQAGRSIYGDSDDNSILTSNAIGAQYALFFGDDAALQTRVGFEDIKEDGNFFFLYDVKLSGRLAKSVEGYVRMDQKPVSDTMQSLSEGIYRRDIQAGITIDYLPSIFLGIDFTYRDYTDENDGKRIHLWSSYRIFSDVSSLDITYDYVKMENKIDSDQQRLNQENFFELDPGYWSPGNYWKHGLSARVKRELWPPGKRQSGSSHIAAQYGIGYEEGDNVLQRFELDILLEISAPFLLKGTFISDWSDDYNCTKAFATFVYRW